MMDLHLMMKKDDLMRWLDFSLTQLCSANDETIGHWINFSNLANTLNGFFSEIIGFWVVMVQLHIVSLLYTI